MRYTRGVIRRLWPGACGNRVYVISIDKILASPYSPHLDDKMNSYPKASAKTLRHDVVRGWMFFARRGLKAG